MNLLKINVNKDYKAIDGIKEENSKAELLLKNVINSSEDINGVVRIFVRVKGGGLKGDPKLNPLQYIVDEKDNVGNKKLILKDDSKEREYSPFYDVFNKDTNNEGIFNKIKPTIEQIDDGYHIAMFGYGYSGSGKSYTLLNTSGNDNGILIRTVGHYLNNGKSVTVVRIQELYNKSFNPNNTNTFAISNCLKDIITELSLQNNNALQIDKAEKFNTLLKQIEDFRKTQGRIKPTINNPESSRGHLFITLKIGEKGFITVCDMAGREDPLEIWENTKMDVKTGELVKGGETSKDAVYIGSVSGRDGVPVKNQITITSQSLISIMIKGDITKENIHKKGVISSKFSLNDKGIGTLINVIDTCKEAHYINETLNHMIKYFDGVKGVNTSFKVGAYVGENYMPNNLIKEIDATWIKTIGIIPILEDIAKTKEKPAKFCLFACVRQEADEKFKEASIKTLTYARDLASISKTNAAVPATKKTYSDAVKEPEKAPYRTVPLKNKGGKTKQRREKTHRIKHKKVNKTQKIKAKKYGDRSVSPRGHPVNPGSVRSAADGSVSTTSTTTPLDPTEAKHGDTPLTPAEAKHVEAKQPAESKSIFDFFS
jgi:hypothetical protein